MSPLHSVPQKLFSRIVFKLRLYRELSDVSQKEAAEMLSIGHRSYQRIESGQSACDIIFLRRFSLVFNIDFLELVSPHPPIVCDFHMFTAEPEYKMFEGHPFVQHSKLIEWTSLFDQGISKVVEHEEFNGLSTPMGCCTPFKKMANAMLVERLSKSRSTKRMGPFFQNIKDKVNYYDSLFVNRPRYSIKKLKGHKLGEQTFDIEVFSVHRFIENEIECLSAVNFISVV